MKTPNSIQVLVGLAGILISLLSAQAQQMPQDNWRYDGIEFAGPDATKPLRCIAIGLGGVYVGYGDPATAIVQFQENGTFIRQFGTFTRILGIACDSTGQVYVLDQGGSKVKAFDQNGTSLREWGGPGSGNGQFSLSSANNTTMIAVDQNDQVYVCDPGNTRVQVFDTAGNFLRKWGELGSLPGQFAANDPDGIAVNPNGWIYALAGSSPNLRIFDTQGGFIKSVNLDYLTQLTVSPDGLLLFENWAYGSLDAYDSSLSRAARNSNFPSTAGLACNARGDVYCVRLNEKNVRIWEREYSGVHNALLPSAIPHPIVLSVAQRSGVPILDIDYRVTDADSSTVTTAALAFLGGNNTLSDVIPMTTFLEGTSANIGANIPTNAEKRITWDMATDWSVDFAQVQVEVLAKDNRAPLGIHWITIPASNGEAALQVSRKPIPDSELLSLWYWYIATHESGMTFANGQAKGTSGLYSGQILASGVRSTTTGRLFAYQKMGVRALTGTELTRALGGNYGFVSVDQNSVVRDSLTPTSSVLAWGESGSGQINTSAALNNAVSVVACYYQSFVITSNGTLWALGHNGNGQLGDGTTSNRSTPFQVATGVSQVSASSSFTLYVKADGTLWAMGNNGNGQLGDGTTIQRTWPVQVATDVSKVAVSENYALFIKTDGTLWAMGNNGCGQLGDGTTTQRNSPVQVTTGVAQVIASPNYALFVKTDGTLWAMGYNGYGQLGDGTTTQRTSPVQVTTGVAQVAAGAIHTLYVKTDGTLWAMGYNGNGQLGDGTTTQRNSPVQVTTGVAQVTAGAYYTLFVKVDGTLWSMGNNDNGQLGDGTTTQRTSPVQVTTGVSKVAVGNNDSLFIKTDGTLWAMGNNGSGQLGDGTTTQRNTPVQVATNITQVSAGSAHTLAIIGTP